MLIYVIPLVLVCVVLVIFGWLALSVMYRFAQAIRSGRGLRLPYQPVVDPNPPAPVRRTAGVLLVGWAGIGWAAIHVAAIALWWTTGWWGERTAVFGVWAIYLCWASATTATGAVMLLARRPYGRRAISLGQFLFVLGAFMGAVIALLSMGAESVSAEMKRIGLIVGILLAAHLVIDAAIGSAGQHVGKPPAPGACQDSETR